ncbi:MAG: winged helix-turn-helix domain-containing protein [Nevskia sp.]|nr:winged helix-turn-helix domain-containing protein [Nevskia sp.]
MGGAPMFVWQFAQAEFDEARWELRVGGQPQELEPRPLEVLLQLLRHAGEVVSREELLEAVYGHQHIGDSALANAVAKLRRALGDEAQTLIATIYRVGYRLAAPVKRVAVAGPERPPLSLKAGDAVPRRGHWKLERLLGGGADAEVWLARHDKTGEQRVFKFSPDGQRLPSLKREVTLFRVLRETLGERREFARVLDWDFEQMPFFIECEYGGRSLPEWAGEQGGLGRLALEQRVELAAQIAEAVAAAHSAGVLHKDLKPENVLMDCDAAGQWRPRLTDFGSGRLLEPGRLEALGITQLSFTQTQSVTADSRSGTPLYLAPEVLAGQAPTAVSDVYALGVMLYQLAVGELRKPLAPGWEQDVADEVLRGDIAQAASGDPARRLGSAAELASRLRQLDERRDSLRRRRETAQHAAGLEARLQRSRLRRPWLIAAGLALSAGLAISFWYYRDAARARDEARQQAEIAQGVGRFLSEDVLGATSRYDMASRRDATVLEALDRGAARLDAQHLPPLVEARIRGMLAYCYTQMSREKSALEQTRKAARLYRAALGPGDPHTLNAEHMVPMLLLFDSRYPEAEAALTQMDADLVRYPAVSTPEDRLARDTMRGALYLNWERYAQALPYYEQALRESDALFPKETASRATRRGMLALVYMRLGRHAEAEGLLQAALDELAGGSDATSIAMTQVPYGIDFYLQRRYAEAEAQLAAAQPVLARNVGADNGDAVEAQDYLGQIELKTGRIDAALRRLRAAYAASLARYGEASLGTLTVQGHLGLAELAAGQRTEGLDTLGRAASGLGQVLAPQAPRSEYFRYRLAGELVRNKERPAEAAGLMAGLDPKVLQLEQPESNWPTQLQQLQAGLSQIQMPQDGTQKSLLATRH